MQTIFDIWLTDTVDIMINHMEMTADPATNHPVNFPPDKKTKLAIAKWLMDQRRPAYYQMIREQQ